MELSFKQICQNPVVKSGGGSVKELVKEIGIRGTRRLFDMSCIVGNPNDFTWKLTDEGKKWVDMFDEKNINNKERRDKIKKILGMYDGI